MGSGMLGVCPLIEILRSQTALQQASQILMVLPKRLNNSAFQQKYYQILDLRQKRLNNLTDSEAVTVSLLSRPLPWRAAGKVIASLRYLLLPQEVLSLQ